MRVVAIIQARMGSTRLPGKVLYDLAGKPMLHHIIERTLRAKLVHKVVVAFPGADALGAFETRSASYAYFDDENDLIGRYYGAAKMYNADLVVRLCADNPFVEPAEIDRAIQHYLDNPCFYVSNMHEHDIYAMLPSPHKYNGYPDGIGCEVFSFSRLQWMNEKITDPALREHPHQYFHNEGLISSPRCPKEFARPKLRLAVDTMEDYLFAKEIYEALSFRANPNPHITDVIEYLDAKNIP